MDRTPAEPLGHAEARAAVAEAWDVLSAATVALAARERAVRGSQDREAAARDALEALERKRRDAWLSGALQPGDPWPELEEDLERADRHMRAAELGVRERERELAAQAERHERAERVLAEAEARLEPFGPAPEGEVPWVSTRESRRRRSGSRRRAAVPATAPPAPRRSRRRFALPLGAGALATVGSRLTGKLLSFGFIVILVRQVTPAEFASYSYLVALALTFSMLSLSGVSMVAGRDVARGDLSLAAAYRGGLATVMGAGVLGAMAVGAFGIVAPGPGIPPEALLLTAAFVLINNLFNFQADLMRGSGRLGLEAGLQMVAGILFVVVGTTVVAMGLGLVALMGAFAFKELVMVGLTQLFLPSPRRGERIPGLGWALFRTGLVMSAATVCLALLLRASLIVLSNVATPDETASYAAAFRFAEIGFMVCQTLGFGLLPAMSARYAADRRLGARFARRLNLICVGGALVLAPLLVFITPWVVTLVFGEEYSGAAASSEILVGMFPLLMLLMISWNALLADRRERPVLVAAVTGVIAAAVSSTWIVSQADARAAALSAAASFGAVAVVCAWNLLRRADAGRRSAPPPRLSSVPVGTSEDALS